MMKQRRYLFLFWLIAQILLSPWGAFSAEPLPAGKLHTLVIAHPVNLGGKQYPHIAAELEEVLKFDLNLSDCVKIVNGPVKDNGRGIRPGDFDYAPWRMSGASLLLKSGYVVEGDRLMAEFRLYDLQTEKQLWSEVFTGKSRFLRKMGHAFVDETLRIITGTEGNFAGKILFVSSRSGNKEVYFMDYDGYNVRQVTRNGSINLNPAYSPDGKEIIFTSYQNGQPNLYLKNLHTGKELMISSRAGLNITGDWSLHGKKIALAMSKDGPTQLYLINERGKELAKLTNDDAINISPSWSPDGRHIAFVSDRDGSPQIYVMNADGGEVRRVTRDGGYNVEPSWSPKGDRILYCRREESGPLFQIYSINSDGSGDTRLTWEGRNEYPRWSPDGRFITFASNRDGQQSIYVMRADGTAQTKVSRGKGDDSQPVWSPRPPSSSRERMDAPINPPLRQQ
jgi:TolB protein